MPIDEHQSESSSTVLSCPTWDGWLALVDLGTFLDLWPRMHSGQCQLHRILSRDCVVIKISDIWRRPYESVAARTCVQAGFGAYARCGPWMFLVRARVWWLQAAQMGL